tara:strand:+ start:38 stop:286 length:249 start_codon:yes stop_codon:yes gene_type:complete
MTRKDLARQIMRRFEAKRYASFPPYDPISPDEVDLPDRYLADLALDHAIDVYYDSYFEHHCDSIAAQGRSNRWMTVHNVLKR